MVVIADLTPYPEGQSNTDGSFYLFNCLTRRYNLGRIHSQIQDARLVLRYIEEHAAEYGGDPTQIYFAGHGLGGLLALLLPIQQAVAESRDDFLNDWNGNDATDAHRIPNGVANLKVYAGEVDVPKIKGLILRVLVHSALECFPQIPQLNW